jgi:hypothetical protein
VTKVLRVGSDLDGVICNYVKRFSEYLREVHGARAPIIDEDDQALDYDWSFYPLEKREIDKAFDEVISIPGFWTSLEPKRPGLLRQFYEEVSKRKIDVYFITSRLEGIGTKSAAHQSAQWLQAQGWEMPNVITSFDKGRVIDALGIEYFIDDHTKNCLDVLSHSRTCNVYLESCKHNEIFNLRHPRFKRSSFSEFINDVLTQHDRNINR